METVDNGGRVRRIEELERENEAMKEALAAAARGVTK